MSDDHRLQIELLKKVLEKSEETKVGITELQGKVDMHIQKTDFELKSITETNITQNNLLEEHRQTGIAQMEYNKIEREKINKKISGIEPRVAKLEKPGELLKLLVKWAAAIGTVAGTIYTIGKLSGWF